MTSYGAQVISGEIPLEHWLIAAFRAERTPRRSRRWLHGANPLTAPLRPMNASLIYWMSLGATLAGWLLR